MLTGSDHFSHWFKCGGSGLFRFPGQGSGLADNESGPWFHPVTGGIIFVGPAISGASVVSGYWRQGWCFA